MPEFKAASRKNFSTSGDLPTHADLKIGTLQRIADAAEAMAKTHIDLIAKRDYWERRALSAEKDLAACGRRNIALRGVITRMQNRVASLARRTPPADWRLDAAKFLHAKADEQEQINKENPAHAECYPSWRHRVDDRRTLAQLLEQQACASPEGLDCADPTITVAPGADHGQM